MASPFGFTMMGPSNEDTGFPVAEVQSDPNALYPWGTPIPVTPTASLNPAQLEAYKAWLAAGGVGAPPSVVTQDPAALAAQQAAAQQAIAVAQGSGLGNAFDLGGTGYGSMNTQAAIAPPPVAAAQPAVWQGGVPPPTAVSSVSGLPPTAAGASDVLWQGGTAAPVGTGNSTPWNPMAGTSYGTQPVIQPQSGNGYTVMPTSVAGAANARPDLVNNWQNANDPAWVAAHPGDAQLVAMIRNYGSLGAYLASGGGAPASGTTTTQPGSAAPGAGGYPTIGGTTTGGTPTPGAAAQPTYAQLLQQYRNTHGGANPASGDDFNAWAGQQPSVIAAGGWSNSQPGTPDTNANFPNVSGPDYGGIGRNLGGELGAISQYINPIAQTGFNAASQFNPQYTNLNVQNYNTALQGVAGSMNQAFQQANPGLTGYTNTLGQYLNSVTANTPTGVASTENYQAAAAAPTTVPNAVQAQMGGPGYSPIGTTNVSPQTGFNALSTPTGNAGLTAAQNSLSGTGPSQIQQTLESQAMRDLQLGRGLSQEDVRNSQQAAREGWGARGLINSTGAVAEEVLNRDAVSRARERERQSFASAVDQTGFGQRNQNFSNALNLSNANLGYANLGLQAGQSNLAAQLQGNQLGFQGQVANQQNALNTGIANQNSGLNYAQLQTGLNSTNAAAQNNMAQFGANLGQANNQFNAQNQNQALQFNANATNNMNQFNQNLNLQGNQNVWNNALAYGNFQQQQAINPFATAQGLSQGTPDYTQQLLGYGSDLYNTNYNAATAARISNANNTAARQGATTSAIGSLAGTAITAKLFFMCVPEGEMIDTAGGRRGIHEIRAGDMVVGYTGAMVKVLHKHEYAEDPHAERFYRFRLDDGQTLAVCDMHRIEGIRAKDWATGNTFASDKTITAIKRFKGVTRSYDLLTEDGGYRMSGVPVNSMIGELAQAAQLMEAK